MAVNLIPPSRQTGTTEEQLNGLYSYLFRLVEALNVSLGSEKAVFVPATKADTALNASAAIPTDTYNELKSLIIKTATEVTGAIRRTVTDIAHDYTAQSEFGTYSEYLNSRITSGADGVVVDWDSRNRLTASVAEFSEYIAESDVYIRVGIVKYNDDGTVEAGVVIGKDLTKVTVDGRELITSQNLYALFTAEELSFWQNGVCRARYGMVDFLVEKGYIDEITTSLIQSSTFGAQLVMRDDVLSAIAANIDLAANESIRLIVQSTAASELRTGTTVTITDEVFHVCSPETKFSIPSPDSGDGEEIVSIDEEGLRSGVVTAGVIHSDSVVSTFAAGSHSPLTPGEMQVLLTSISGKWLSGDVLIDAASITGGSFEISGLYGHGRLIISGGTLNSVSVKDSGCIVEIRNSTLSITGVAINADNARVQLTSVIFDATTGADASNGAQVLMDSCTGSTSNIINAYDTSIVRIKTSKPWGRIGVCEGEVYSYSAIDSGSSGGGSFTPVTPGVATAAFTAVKTRTWGGGWLSESTFGDHLYQGATGGDTLRRGLMWFDLSALAGKTVVSATLTLRRVSGIGGGGNVSIGIYGSTSATDAGTPAIGAKFTSMALADGASGTADVTEAVKQLISGGISSLMVYDSRTAAFDGKSYTHGYAKLQGASSAGAPKLTITYR